MHERASQKHIGLYFLIWYGAINDSIGQNTNRWEYLWINYASERGASERGKFSLFHILKLLFLQYSVGTCTSDTLSPYIFRSQITSSYTYNQYSPLLWYGVVNKRQYNTDKTLTLRKFSHFLHSKTAIYFFQYILLVLQILFRYKWHACRLTCTDKTLKKHYCGGGGGLSGYANGWQCQGSRYNDLGNRAANLKILVCLVVFLCWIKRFVLLSLCLNVNIWIDIYQVFKNRGGTIPPRKIRGGGHVPPPPPPRDRRLCPWPNQRYFTCGEMHVCPMAND